MASRPQSRLGDVGWLLPAAWRSLPLAQTLRGLRPTAGARPRLYLLDPSYEQEIGHYGSVARHLAEACAARSWLFVHLTGPQDRPPNGPRIPWFRRDARLPMRIYRPELGPKVLHGIRGDTRRSLRVFIRDLGAALALDRLIFPEGEAYFFFYTGDLLHPWAYLERGPLGPRQHLAVFQFNLPPHFEKATQQKRFSRHAKLLAQRLEAGKGANATRVRLCTDSPALGRLLKPALGSSLAYACPPLVGPEDLETLPTPEEIARRPHPLGYFGYLSEKHGWPILRELLEAQAGRQSRWLLKINPKRHPEDVAVAQQAATAAGATLQLGFFPEAEYHASLDRCASLLLPYRPQQYAFLSSGKLIDALRHGCLPIVPANTWLAETVRQLDYGLVVAPQYWGAVPACLAVLDLPALWARRRAAVREFLGRFTAACLLDSLAAPVARGPFEASGHP